MWDFAKAFFSFSWAMSLFGMQQFANLVTPSKGAAAFRDMAQFTEAGLSKELRAAFREGDNLQKSIFDGAHDRFTRKKRDGSPGEIHDERAATVFPSEGAIRQADRNSQHPPAPPSSTPPATAKPQVPTTEIGWGPMPKKDNETGNTPLVGWGPMPS